MAASTAKRSLTFHWTQSCGPRPTVREVREMLDKRATIKEMFNKTALVQVMLSIAVVVSPGPAQWSCLQLGRLAPMVRTWG